MSCCMVVSLALPAGVNLLSGALLAAVTAAAASLDLSLDGQADEKAAENSVDLCLNQAAEVTGNLSCGQKLSFSGPGLKAVFYLDAEGQAAVRVAGRQSPAELSALGRDLARKVIQQYAYHRLVTEMKARNMNVVEEEVEADGSVRLKVRVFQG